VQIHLLQFLNCAQVYLPLVQLRLSRIKPGLVRKQHLLGFNVFILPIANITKSILHHLKLRLALFLLASFYVAKVFI